MATYWLITSISQTIHPLQVLQAPLGKDTCDEKGHLRSIGKILLQEITTAGSFVVKTGLLFCSKHCRASDSQHNSIPAWTIEASFLYVPRLEPLWIINSGYVFSKCRLPRDADCKRKADSVSECRRTWVVNKSCLPGIDLRILQRAEYRHFKKNKSHVYAWKTPATPES